MDAVVELPASLRGPRCRMLKLRLSRVSMLNIVDIGVSCPIEAFEPACCRFNLSFHLQADALLRDGFGVRYAAASAGKGGTATPDFTLTCRASNASPLVITAHKMRAFLVANAIAAA